MRHGKSSYSESRSLRGDKFNHWLNAYNAAGIRGDLLPSEETCSKAVSVKRVFASDLHRSIESSTLLGIKDNLVIDPIFREVDVPSGFVAPLRLRPQVWVVIGRLLWLFGFKRNSESLSEARCRARKAAHLLIEHAREVDSVMLVGHLVMNRLIAAELKQHGWIGPRNPGIGYWAWNSYKYPST